jgi:hypothetical protein
MEGEGVVVKWYFKLRTHQVNDMKAYCVWGVGV